MEWHAARCVSAQGVGLGARRTCDSIYSFISQDCRNAKRPSFSFFSLETSSPRALSLPRARRPHTDRVTRNMGCGASTAKHGAKSVLMTSVPSVDAKTMRRIRRRSCAVGLQASPTKSTRQVTKFVPMNDVELIKED